MRLQSSAPEIKTSKFKGIKNEAEELGGQLVEEGMKKLYKCKTEGWGWGRGVR